jgi:hypothetical protein
VPGVSLLGKTKIGEKLYCRARIQLLKNLWLLADEAEILGRIICAAMYDLSAGFI